MKKRMKQILALMLVAGMTVSSPLSYLTPVSAAVNDGSDNLETVSVGLIGDGVREGSFNNDWSFEYAGTKDIEGAQAKDYNDSTWRKLNLPHDYSIEQAFTVAGEAESGFLPGGIGWYRKHFVVPEDYSGKDIQINFDGSYMNTDVYVNGEKLGTNNYGYTPFSFDITDYLVCDGTTENVIAVKVNNPIPTSRWYSGSGIYRDVTLSITDNVHVAYEGTDISTPNLEAQKDGAVDVNVSTEVENETDAPKQVSVRTTIMDGDVVISEPITSDSVAVEAGTITTVDQTTVVNQPKLWSVEEANLYQVKTEVLVDGEVTDTYSSDFGFRYTSWDRETGFSLNGEKLKLKGVCMHHDQGALGSVANYRATERQMQKMKDMGVNTIRVTHNPASSVLLDVCNKLGLLVINEAFDGWAQSKNGNNNDFTKYFKKTLGEGNQLENGTADMTWGEFTTKAMVKSSKNDPCIIMWSIGNEVFEGAGGDMSDYPQIAQNIIDWIKEIDTTREVTFGDNETKNNPNNMSARAALVAKVVAENGGIVGVNYPHRQGAAYNNIFSNGQNWTIYGSETSSAIRSRGVYTTKDQDNTNLQVTAYDKKCVGWGDYANDSWYGTITRDYVAGEFIWTGFDYIGEPTNWNGTGTGSVSGQGPIPKSSFFGIVDTAGLEKDVYYLYQSMWNEDVNTLHILPSWNEDEIITSGSNKEVEVVVYSDAARVDLYLNDSKIGTKSFNKHTTDAGFTYQTVEGSDSVAYATFNVPYVAGTLSAKAYDKDGNEITDTQGRKEIVTSGEASDLSLTADRETITANGSDLCYVTVDVTDSEGNIVNDASNQLNFTLEGQGKIVGMDNGNPSDADSYKPTSDTVGNRKAFSGKAVVIVQSTEKAGNFTLKASGAGIAEQSITVTTEKEAGSGDANIKSYEIAKNIYTNLNETPNLPSTVNANYSDDSTKELSIVWDAYDKEQLKQPGIFKITGKLADTEVAVAVTIHVVGDLATIQNYATFTYQNIKPTLPKTLPGFLADGTKTEEFKVVWDSVSEEQVANVGSFVVKGSVNVLDYSFEVSAQVRVEEGLPYPENIALNTYSDAPKLSESCTTPADNLNAINDGSGNGSATNGRWTNWNVKNSVDGSYVQLDWSKKYNISRLELWLFKDSQTPIPESVTIYYKDENGEYQTAAESHITMVPYQDGSTTYGLLTPAYTDSIRLYLTPITKGTCVGLTEVEVYEAISEVEPYTSADLGEIKLDNVALEGFDPAIKNYVMEKQQAPTTVEATSTENASVTILPVYNNMSKIIVTSEDGSKTNIYTIQYTETATVIKVGLEEIIQEATALLAEDYTEDSFAAMKLKLTEAEKVYDDINATQLQVNEAIKALRTAINNLVENTPDIAVTKDELKAAIDSAKTKDQAEYTPESYAVLTEKLELAEKVYADDEATQIQVDAAKEALNTAIKNLVPLNTEPTELETDGMTATAGDEQAATSSEGPASYVLDNDPATLWHTNWNGSDRAKHWIQLDLGATYDINGIMATPRSNAGSGTITSGDNGVITKYQVQVSMDGTKYTTVSMGNWERTTGAKAGAIAALIPARYVKLISLESTSDQAGKEFTSLAELRVVGKTHQEIVDKTAAIGLTFEEVIAKGNYTDETYDAYTASITGLTTVIAKADATQEEVDEAISTYTEAKEGLKENDPNVPVEKVTLSKDKVELKVGATETITATVNPSDASDKTVTWATDKASVATVVGGKITAIAEGTAKITATAGGKTATCTVTVTKANVAVENVTLSKDKVELKVGATETITATVNPSDASDKTVTWKTDKESVATVVGGKITAVAEGTAKITATAGGKTATCTVTVTKVNVPVEKVTLSKDKVELKVGATETITATVNPSDASDKTVTWATDKASVATVADGKITAVAEGTAKITATAGGKTATCVVTVTKVEHPTNGWYHDKNKDMWKYYENNIAAKSKWIQVYGAWYYMGSDEYMTTNWQLIGGKWYYLGNNGKMVTKWSKIDNKWYYFNKSGAMVTKWQKIDNKWYYFNKSGAMKTNWYKEGNTWYYLKTSGAMATGWNKIGGSWYYMNESGKMQTGWEKVKGEWYFMQSSGKMVTGWYKIGNKYWYFNKSTGAWNGQTRNY